MPVLPTVPPTRIPTERLVAVGHEALGRFIRPGAREVRADALAEARDVYAELLARAQQGDEVALREMVRLLHDSSMVQQLGVDPVKVVSCVPAGQLASALDDLPLTVRELLAAHDAAASDEARGVLVERSAGALGITDPDLLREIMLDPAFPEELAQESARRASGTLDQLLALVNRWRASPAVVSAIEVNLVNAAVAEQRIEVLEALSVEARTQVVRDAAASAVGTLHLDVLRVLGPGSGEPELHAGADRLRQARLWIDRTSGANAHARELMDALRVEITRVETWLHDEEGRSLAEALGALFGAAPTSLARWDDQRLHLEARARVWMRAERARHVMSPSASELRAALDLAQRHGQEWGRSHATVGAPTPVAFAFAAHGTTTNDGLYPPDLLCPHCSSWIRQGSAFCGQCGGPVRPVDTMASCFVDVVLRLTGPIDPVEGWKPDPTGRFPERYWNGSDWERWVRDRPGGTRSEDPIAGTVRAGRPISTRRLGAPSDPGEGWKPDPTGRHPERYWDGTAWTMWVYDRRRETREEDRLGR